MSRSCYLLHLPIWPMHIVETTTVPQISPVSGMQSQCNRLPLSTQAVSVQDRAGVSGYTRLTLHAQTKLTSVFSCFLYVLVLLPLRLL